MHSLKEYISTNELLFNIHRLDGPISAEGLDHIANHKYVGGAYTPLDQLLNPFWYWATEQLPLWLAPNAVTVSIFLFLLLNKSRSLYWTERRAITSVHTHIVGVRPIVAYPRLPPGCVVLPHLLRG
jgi:hypothetical protein